MKTATKHKGRKIPFHAQTKNAAKAARLSYFWGMEPKVRQIQRPKANPNLLKVEGRAIEMMGELGYDYDARGVIAQIEAMNRGGEEFEMRIMSDGGSAVEALAIYQYMKETQPNAVAKIYGLAASAATVIACGARRVLMGDVSLWAIHSPYTYEVVEDGEYYSLQKVIQPQLQASFARVYAGKTGKTEDEMRALMESGDENILIMSADEALAAGFVDEILSDNRNSVAAFSQIFSKTDINMSFLKTIRAALGQKPDDVTDTEPVTPLTADEQAVADKLAERLQMAENAATVAIAATEAQAKSEAAITALSAQVAELAKALAANKATGKTSPQSADANTGEPEPEDDAAKIAGANARILELAKAKLTGATPTK